MQIILGAVNLKNVAWICKSTSLMGQNVKGQIWIKLVLVKIGEEILSILLW